LLVVVALLFMIAAIVWTYDYSYPSGRRPDLLSFLAFWLRELLILGAALACLVVIAVGAIVKAVLRNREKSR